MVEVVHLYSNLHSMTMFQLRVKARATLRPRDRPASRQTQTRLDPYQSNALAMAYRGGKTIKELACIFGVHRVTVGSLLRRHGVEPHEIGLTDMEVAEACRLYPDGWSLARLAERYDVDDMTVRRHLLQAGVEMRSPHERRRRSD
jgi:DNA-directed RNA polymerase specialized sigma24 family protein